MASLVEVESYDEGIYRIETSDQVLGGDLGTSNKSAKGLANRTNWLKARWIEISALLESINLTIAGLKSAATKVANAVKTNGDVPLWDSVYSVTQVDLLLANAGLRLASGTATVGDVPGEGKSVTISLGKTLNNNSYMVFGSTVSKGTPATDTTVSWIVESRGTTSFIVRFQEWTTGIQNIDFDWEIKAK